MSALTEPTPPFIIRPDLWQGDWTTPMHPSVLESGVDVIISIRTRSLTPTPPKIKQVCLWTDDHDDWLPVQIHGWMKHFGAKTLVHCKAGQNRSSALVVARLLFLHFGLAGALQYFYQQRWGQEPPPRMFPAMLRNLDNYAAWLRKMRP